MNARISQMPPDPYRPASSTDAMAECPTCHIEWAWGAPWEKLQRFVAEHNLRHHLVTNAT